LGTESRVAFTTNGTIRFPTCSAVITTDILGSECRMVSRVLKPEFHEYCSVIFGSRWSTVHSRPKCRQMERILWMAVSRTQWTLSDSDDRKSDSNLVWNISGPNCLLISGIC